MASVQSLEISDNLSELDEAKMSKDERLREGTENESVAAMTTSEFYQATIGSQSLSLPIVELSSDLGVALLISVDHGVRFSEQAGRDLAEKLRSLEVEVIVSVATMGIPLAIETSRCLGIDDYLILHKTRKIHLANGYSHVVKSITTENEQRLFLDRARAHIISDKRVAVIDDVISTGGSMAAAVNLVREVGGSPVALGCMATEGTGWKEELGDDVELVVSLGAMPLFRRTTDGNLEESWT